MNPSLSLQVQTGLVGLLLAVTVAPASAAGTASPADDGWRFGATLYVWVPSISGTTRFPSGASGPSIDLRADEVLDKLDSALMGTIEARRGAWGGLADWVYSDLSARKSASRDFSIGGVPVGTATADLGLGVKTNVVTLAGTYAVLDTPLNTTSLVAGARMLKTEQTLDWNFASGPVLGVAASGSSSASTTSWDAIVGVRGRARYEIDSRWFWPYHFDVGTGESRRTLQAAAGVAYAFDFGEVGLAWRYLDYRFDSSEAVQSLKFNGLALGVAFRF
jgi:hypothetical protein